jgi:acetyltransferase-like isoleucine patch superfamily enzyme
MMRIYGKVKNKLLASSYLLFNPINKVKFMLNGVKYGKNIRIRGTIDIRHPDNGEIILGNNVLINSAAWANPIGFADKTRFELFDEGSIYIGDYVGLSNVAIASSSDVCIGNNVLIGAGSKIYGTDFHPISVKYRDGKEQTPGKTGNKPIIIEDGVFVGAGCIIMKGVHIGKNSVIGAGSVVTKKIPSNQIWAGNPAIFIKKIDNE